MHSVRCRPSCQQMRAYLATRPRLGVRTLEIGSDGRLVDLISHVRCGALRASCERISTLSYQILRKMQSISIPECRVHRVSCAVWACACGMCGMCDMCGMCRVWRVCLAVQETLTTSM
jgi:hypothetical protein